MHKQPLRTNFRKGSHFEMKDGQQIFTPREEEASVYIEEQSLFYIDRFICRCKQIWQKGQALVDLTQLQQQEDTMKETIALLPARYHSPPASLLWLNRFFVAICSWTTVINGRLE